MVAIARTGPIALPRRRGIPFLLDPRLRKAVEAVSLDLSRSLGRGWRESLCFRRRAGEEDCRKQWGFRLRRVGSETGPSRDVYLLLPLALDPGVAAAA